MMLRTLTILLFVVASISFIIFEASAKCVEDHCYGIPGMSPLKEQLEVHTLISNIRCQNQEHVLVERPNGKLACVTNHTAHKTGWLMHHYTMADSKGEKIVPREGIVHIIPFETTGLILKDLSFENNSLVATIKHNEEYGVLSLYIQHKLLQPNPKQCYSVNDTSQGLSYVVFINGERNKISESKSFFGEPVLNIHTVGDAKTIEIVGICRN